MSRGLTILAVLACGALVAVGVVLTTAPSKSIRATHREPRTVIALRMSTIDSVIARPDGSLRVATQGEVPDTSPDGDGPLPTGQETIREFADDGRPTTTLNLPGSSAGRLIANLGFRVTAAGSIAAYGTEPRDPHGDTTDAVVHVISRDVAGRETGRDALELGDDVVPDQPVVGPTGAVALTASSDPDARSAGSTSEWLAFRAAGAAHMSAPVELTAGSHPVLNPRVVMGPDGGGVLVEWTGGPSSILRRISPAGRLGPALPLTVPHADAVEDAIAYGPDGTLVIALVSSPPRGEPARDALFVSTLAPGADRPSTPVAVAGSAVADDLDGDATIAVGSGDRTIVAAEEKAGLALYEGAPGALRKTTVRAGAAQGAHVLLAADGAVTVVWEGGSPDARGRVEAIRRAAGSASFGPTTQVSSPAVSSALLSDAVPTAHDNVAIAYAAEDGEHSYLVPAIWP